MKNIYADHNSNTNIIDDARNAIIDIMEVFGNPSSVHFSGRNIRKHVEKSREIISDFLKTQPKNIIFTSGASESASWILNGYDGPVIIAGDCHDCLTKPRQDAKFIKILSNGQIDKDNLKKLIDECDKDPLVCFMHSNNETGIVQDAKSIIEIIKSMNAYVLCDIVQSSGKIEICDHTLSSDFLIMSSHKIGGPTGVGCAKISEKIQIKQLIHGGGQERSFRGGTENIIGIVGFGAAVSKIDHAKYKKVEELRNFFEEEIMNGFKTSLIIGKDQIRLPNTTCVAMPGISSETQVMNFDINGIHISAGSACSSGKVKKSNVLDAMGLSEDISKSAVRFSFGRDLEKEHIKSIIDVWNNLYKKYKDRGPPDISEKFELTAMAV